MAKKYDHPDKHDPLGEPTLNRRLWAAYLRAGYDRAGFAKAMKVRYNNVLNWDHGKFVMSLAHFIRGAGLVGYSMEELVHGYARSGSSTTAPPVRHEDALTADGVRAVLLDARADQAQIKALGEHQESVEGRLQPMTRTYVTTFVNAYAAATKGPGKKSHSAAMRHAMTEAVNARALVSALDGERKPLFVTSTKPKPKPRRRSARVPTRGPETTSH